METREGSRWVSESDYRTMMSCFPTGVAVVTAMDQLGGPHGMTCTSLCSVSLAPPTLLVSLHVDSGTRRAIRDSGCFAVNFLHARGRRAAELFSRSVPDRFARVAWQASEVVGSPWLVDDAFALAECRTSDTLLAGDHAVVLGEVVNALYASGKPLLYGLRQYSTWPVGPELSPGNGRSSRIAGV